MLSKWYPNPLLRVVPGPEEGKGDNSDSSDGSGDSISDDSDGSDEENTNHEANKVNDNGSQRANSRCPEIGGLEK